MSLRRYNNPNHARFVTFSTFRQTDLFDSDAIRTEFVEQLRCARTKHDILLYAWVVMPNHVHLLVRESGSGVLEPFLRSLKTGFAKRMLAKWRRESPLLIEELTSPKGQVRFWQRGGGYDRNVFSEAEIREKIDYIQMNPVRAGLVVRPRDWAWSSARFWSGDRDGEIECDQF
ncbi:MAG: transposase [bacterium]|nr:transposase [bacterium]